MSHRTWVKIFCEGWLDGTLREETPELRGIWTDVLAWAGDTDGLEGTIKITKSMGFEDKQIASRLNITWAIWDKIKRRLIETERIKVVENNIIQVCNWKKYQSDYWRQKPYRTQRLQDEVTTESNNPKLQPKVTHRSRSRLEVEVDLKDSKQGETPSPEVKLSPIKKAKVEIPPSVEIYHRLTNLFPAKAWWKILDETISDDPDALVLWHRVVTGWLGMSWSPKSVKLMLDYFRRRQIPGEKDREWIPADTEPAPIEITEEQAEANKKRLAEMIAGVTSRMAV